MLNRTGPVKIQSRIKTSNMVVPNSLNTTALDTSLGGSNQQSANASSQPKHFTRKQSQHTKFNDSLNISDQNSI